MIAIVLPSDIAASVEQAALAKGTTPELLALETLREQFLPVEPAPAKSLYDGLADYIGSIDGPAEPLSTSCGERFAEYLVEKHKKKSMP